MNKKIARLTGIVKLVALGLLLVVLMVTMAITSVPEEAPDSAEERYAKFTAQEEYYRVMDLYGDEEGAVEAARMVFERETPQ